MMLCQTCQFWDRENAWPGDKKNKACCRALAPTITPNRFGYDAEWPTTKSTDWCGMWTEASENRDNRIRTIQTMLEDVERARKGLDATSGVYDHHFPILPESKA